MEEELQRHCEEEDDEKEDTVEKPDGDKHFMEDGRGAVALAADLVLRARAKMAEATVIGQDDSTVAERSRSSFKVYDVTRCFRAPFVGQEGAPDTQRTCKLVFLSTFDAEPSQGIRSYRAIAVTSVLLKWYATCIILHFESEKGARRMAATARGMGRWGLEASVIAETMRVSGRVKERQLARQRTMTHDAYCKDGHQDGLRCAIILGRVLLQLCYVSW